MADLIEILQRTGTISLSPFWFPVLLWTCLSLFILILIHYSKSAYAIFQYHGRIALLYGLPVGLGLSLLTGQLLKEFSGAGVSGKFIVVQNPITVTAEMTRQIDWGNPLLWVGLATLLAVTGAVTYTIKVMADFVLLNRFDALLNTISLTELDDISDNNLSLVKNCSKDITVAFSEDTEVPFTFGWINPVIVFPCSLKREAWKLNIVLRHELMHIKNRDYLLNNICVVIKALFWFHPLVHQLHKNIEEFREISCDSEVLADTTISQRKYAQLLFELAPKSVFSNSQSVSMAVHPSSLKKRIIIMKEQHFSNNLFKSSLIIALVAMLSVAGILACSDLQDTGVTNKDVAQAQSQIQNNTSGPQPLYVINGEIMETEKEKNTVSRIKPMYIKSITVLKDQDAIDAYGEAGKHGVIKLEIINQEKAFADLMDKAPSAIDASKPGKDFFVVVEEMPQLIGGLASLQKNISYPEMARKAGIEGRVIVQFIVNKQGKVEDPNIVRGIGAGCDQEALEAVKQAQFKPGKQRGKAVPVQYSLPIIFKLPKEQSSQQNISDNGSSAQLGVMKVNQSPMQLKNVVYKEDGSISGQVIKTQNGASLPGANVLVMNTSIGTATDREGKFALKGINTDNDPIQLSISYIGFKTIHVDLSQE